GDSSLEMASPPAVDPRSRLPVRRKSEPTLAAQVRPETPSTLRLGRTSVKVIFSAFRERACLSLVDHASMEDGPCSAARLGRLPDQNDGLVRSRCGLSVSSQTPPPCKSPLEGMPSGVCVSDVLASRRTLGR